MEQAVSLEAMLEAREQRAERQQRLLAAYDGALVCFTMNIAGPVKNSPLIRRGFRLGCRLLEGQLLRVRGRLLRRELYDEPTGCEAFFLVDMNPLELKELTVELEDSCDLGRLFDMDVLTRAGGKIDRQALGSEGRVCLLCGRPAQVCARSRAHSLEDLRERTDNILRQALAYHDARRGAELACRALLYEVCATPKPGLVDRLGNGSHRDMDIFTFMNSAATLWPYFEQCARTGQETAARPAAETFAALRLWGKLAEGAMLTATGGVNTHKGAIFSMGILCAALGRVDSESWRCPEIILKECAAMTAGLVAADFAGLTAETAKTAGQRLYLEHGITGIRGQLEAGLPAVLSAGLPTLERSVARGRSLNDAGCAALLALIAANQDTNLIARGGLTAQREAAQAAGRLLEREPDPPRESLEALDRAFVEKNLSPGGCADLLAITYLLYFLKQDES